MNTQIKETNKEITERLSAELEKNIEELIASDDWGKYLKFIKGQHTYSWNNTELIWFQSMLYGFEATYVRGAKQWNKIGRYVNKGEKAIWILAPKISWKCGESKEVCSYKGRMLFDKVSKKYYCPMDRRHRTAKFMTGFMSVPVFDLSQTNGEEINIVTLKDVCDDATQDMWNALEDIAKSHGYTVREGATGGADGYCSDTRKEIVIDRSASFGYKVKTLIHEVTHAIAHEGITDYQLNRARYETEAEGVAWIVGQALGIHSDSDNYSFGYISQWGGDNTKKLVRESLGRIQKTANQILNELSEKFELATLG